MTHAEGELLRAVLNPVRPEAPAGADSRNEPRHEAIRAEISRLDRAEGPSIRWDLVEREGCQLLAEQSKDLLVASYVACALQERSGPEGLAHGLQALAQMLTTYGAATFPLRTRARANALEWLVERASTRLSSSPITNAETLRDLRAHVSALQDAARALLGDDAPSFARMGQALQRAAADLSVQAAGAPHAPESPRPPSSTQETAPPAVDSRPPPPLRSTDANASAAAAPMRSAEMRDADPPTPPTPREPPPASAPVLVPSPPGGSPASSTAEQRDTALATKREAEAPLLNPPLPVPSVETTPLRVPGPPLSETGELTPAMVTDYLLETSQALVRLAVTLFESDRTKARAYRVLRAGVWLSVERVPLPDKRGRVPVDAPNPLARAKLAAAARSQQWEEVVVQSEAIFSKNPLWVDAHWYTAQALKQLGPAFEGARAVVELEACGFVERYPHVLVAQFRDGTALAGAEAVEWLRPQAAQRVSETGDQPRQADAGPSLFARSVQGNRDASTELETRLRGCSSARESFQLRLELARALDEAGRVEQAMQLYLVLEEDIERHALHVWEPDLAIAVLRPMNVLFAKARAKGVTWVGADRVHAKLARLAPTALW